MIILDSVKKVLSETEIERIVANMKASMAMEDMVPSDKTIEITKEYLRGNITEKEAIELIDINIKNIIG